MMSRSISISVLAGLVILTLGAVAPTTPGGIRSGVRAQNDRLVNDDHPWKRASMWRIEGEEEGDHLGFSFYKYGAMVFFGHSCNQLEFHGKRSGGYAACATLVAAEDYNELQVREARDRNSITLRFPLEGKGDPTISTEFDGTPLVIAPRGDLTLAPRGDLKIPGYLQVRRFTNAGPNQYSILECEYNGQRLRLAVLPMP